MNQDNGPPTMEQVLGNKRCSPLTLKEFEGYLIHVSAVSRHCDRE